MFNFWENHHAVFHVTVSFCILLYKDCNFSTSLSTLFFFLWDGFEFRALCLQIRYLLLEPRLQSVLLWLFWRCGSQTVCPGWPQTTILLISASWVDRITGVRHRHWAARIPSIFWIGVFYQIANFVTCLFTFFSIFFGGLVLEFELRASCLLGALPLEPCLQPFALVTLDIGSQFFFYPGWPILLPAVVGMTGVY
jgi:hypothetical protein